MLLLVPCKDGMLSVIWDVVKWVSLLSRTRTQTLHQNVKRIWKILVVTLTFPSQYKCQPVSMVNILVFYDLGLQRQKTPGSLENAERALIIGEGDKQFSMLTLICDIWCIFLQKSSHICLMHFSMQIVGSQVVADWWTSPYYFSFHIYLKGALCTLEPEFIRFWSL